MIGAHTCQGIFRIANGNESHSAGDQQAGQNVSSLHIKRMSGLSLSVAVQTLLEQILCYKVQCRYVRC